MPALENYGVEDDTDSVGNQTAWVDAGATSAALDNALPFVVVGAFNHRNENGGDTGSQLEGRLGTTRLGLASQRTDFGNTNLGDDAGGVGSLLALVTGNGSDTLNLRRQCVNVVGGQQQRVGGKAWVAFRPPGTQNVDWFWSETANSEAASVTPSGSTWSRAGGETDVAVTASGEVAVTPSSTGNWLILAYVEGFAAAGAASSSEMRTRLRMVTDPSGSPSTATIGHEAETSEQVLSTNPQHRQTPHFQVDVRSLTAGTTYRFQYEVSNVGAATDVSFRRFRVLAVRLGAFTGSAFITNAGDIQANSGEDDGANDLTYNFSASAHDVVVLGNASTQNGGAWGQLYLREDPAGSPSDHPPGGRLGITSDNTMAATGDYADVPAVARQAGVTGAQTMRLVGQSDGATIAFGRTRGNTAAQRTVLVALMMDESESAVPISMSTTGAMAVDGASEQTHAISVGPVVGVMSVDGAALEVVSIASSPAGPLSVDGSSAQTHTIVPSFDVGAMDVDGAATTVGSIPIAMATTGALSADGSSAQTHAISAGPLVGSVGVGGQSLVFSEISASAAGVLAIGGEGFEVVLVSTLSTGSLAVDGSVGLVPSIPIAASAAGALAVDGSSLQIHQIEWSAIGALSMTEPADEAWLAALRRSRATVVSRELVGSGDGPIVSR